MKINSCPHTIYSSSIVNMAHIAIYIKDLNTCICSLSNNNQINKVHPLIFDYIKLKVFI